MLEANRNKKQRRKIAVNLDTGDGEELVYMFVYPSERVIDTLNDDREFLPFERPDGSLTIVAKKIIRRMSPLDAGRQVDARDPYDLLGITMTASDTEVQEAYHRAVAAVHPDRVNALGLPADFMEMATRKAALLNDAYRKIKAVRKAEAADA
ncbi:MAG: DnaJ domain-containing protein [Dongiaceae bacterium]